MKRLDGIRRGEPSEGGRSAQRKLRAQVLLAAISDLMIRDVGSTHVGACHVRSKPQAS